MSFFANLKKQDEQRRQAARERKAAHDAEEQEAVLAKGPERRGNIYVDNGNHPYAVDGEKKLVTKQLQAKQKDERHKKLGLDGDSLVGITRYTGSSRAGREAAAAGASKKELTVDAKKFLEKSSADLSANTLAASLGAPTIKTDPKKLLKTSSSRSELPASTKNSTRGVAKVAKKRSSRYIESDEDDERKETRKRRKSAKQIDEENRQKMFGFLGDQEGFESN